MAIQLKSSNAGVGGVKLTTIPSSKLNRINRIRHDLDQGYAEQETQNEATRLGLGYINLYGFPIDTADLILVSKEQAEASRIGVFSAKSMLAMLATPQPNTPGQQEIIQSLESRGYKTKLNLCSAASFNKLINTYKFIVHQTDYVDEISVNQSSMDSAANQLSGLQELGTKLVTMPMSEIVETVLSAALKNDASDIHFEPEKDTYNLRLRIDGVLQTFAKLPNSIKHAVEQRLKLISGLKLNVDNVPQDGRFSFKLEDKNVDVRVSMLPSNYGYSVVMRLLGTGSVALELTQLGFSSLANKQITVALAKPQGLILTTGPTGSGKTTTLYSFLKSYNDGQSKIITLEDPVEYKLEGISQTQIDAAAGYNFASGLRSILRQDPDVVMVGEIRDRETAETAVQASLTGHQVLSTVHTNDAAGAIPRLMEMQVKGFLLADSLSAVIGQRLVRKLCTQCRQPANLTPEQGNLVNASLAKITPESRSIIPANFQFFKAVGCPVCNGLGYKGRLGVYEIMTMTDGLRQLISNQFPSIVDVRNMATSEGMVTMFQDGIIKCMQGLTDLDELTRNVSD